MRCLSDVARSGQKKMAVNLSFSIAPCWEFRDKAYDEGKQQKGAVGAFSATLS
jgi:hypothetical protein